MSFYAYEELKNKEDYLNLLNEIEAYRYLDGQDFDFGTGVIKNDMSYGSEDAYYEMDVQSLEETLQYWDEIMNCQYKKNKKNFEVNSNYFNHKEKRKEKQKMNRLYEVSSMVVADRGWKQRVYRGKRSSFLKKVSNKKVRMYKGDLPSKGRTHAKVYDFWYMLS